MDLIDYLWNLLKKYWWIFLVIAILLIIKDALSMGLDWSNWAKSAEPPGSGAITLWGRSLWDWAGLLLVPLVLAIGGFLFQRSERNTDREIAGKRHETDQQIATERHQTDQQIADERHVSDQRIAEEARMDKTLDDYLEAMTGFVLQKNSLLNSKKDDPIRIFARTQTITVIKRLDSKRNLIVIQFLQEANLISKMKGDDTNEVEKPIISLTMADLSGANLERANLQGAILEKANLERANLEDANLEDAQLGGAHLEDAHLEDAHLGGAHLKDAHLEDAHLEDAQLGGADLEDAHLEGAHLERTDLQGANLKGVNLTRANLTGANLIIAYLTGATLSEADLIEANLKEAKLEDAELRWAKLHKADLTGADLTGADLTGANLQGAIFSDFSSILREGYFEGTTMPDGTIFSESTDLKKFTEPTEEE